MRLHGASAFTAVYRSRVRATVGLLTVYAIPNGKAYNRLGLSVPRGSGTAITRNRIKRRLREAFRRTQHQLPCGYDLSIRVRQHEPRTLVEYEAWLVSAIRSVHESWSKRRPKPRD